MKSGLDHARNLILKAENDLKIAEIGLEHEAPLDTKLFSFSTGSRKVIESRVDLPEY